MDLANHGKSLDADGILVTDASNRFQWVEDAIRRFHPRLRLVFDRMLGRWVIARRDFDLLSTKTGEPDVPVLQYLREVWTVIFDLRWSIYNDWQHEHHYREPGQWVIERLGWMDPEQFEPDNSKWVQRRIREGAEAREEKARKRREAKVEQRVADAAFTAGRVVSSIPKTYEVGA